MPSDTTDEVGSGCLLLNHLRCREDSVELMLDYSTVATAAPDVVVASNASTSVSIPLLTGRSSLNRCTQRFHNGFWVSLSLAPVNPDWFYLLVPSHPDSPGHRPIKWVLLLFQVIVDIASILRHISKVTPHRSRLVLRWVTCLQQAYDVGVRPIQPPNLSGTGNKNEPEGGHALWLGSKVRHGWMNMSFIDTCAVPEHIRDV